MESIKMTKSRMKILQTLEDLLQRKSLEDISVSEIVARSGVARKTFYRHFRDKFDALNFYFYLFYQESFEKMNQGERWEDALYEYLSVCEAKADVLIHAYAGSEYGGLQKYDIDITEKTYRKYLMANGVDVETREMKFAIRMAASGGTSMIIEWIQSGRKVEKATMVSLIKRTLPMDVYRELFQNDTNASF